MKKIFLAAFLVSIIGFGGVAEAQTTTTVLQSPNAQKLAALEVQVQSAQMELIKQLIAQVTALQEQLSRLLAAQGQVLVPDKPITQKPVIKNVKSKAASDWEIRAGDAASIQGSNLSGVTAVLFNCCKPDYEIRPTSVSDTIVTFNVPANYVGKDVVQLWVTGRNGASEYSRVTVLVPGSVSSQVLELTSPSGGESYTNDSRTLDIKYRSKGLKGEEIIAYLHKPNTHYSEHTRSATVKVTSDNGIIGMEIQKVHTQEPGKYIITICALVPGKDFCRTSGTFELIGEMGDAYVTDSFINTGGAGSAEYSYTVHNMRNGLTLWAEPEVYCDDKYIAPIKRDCSKSMIFFAWSEGGVKGDGGQMNPYVKGGASYQLPTSLSKTFITTSGIAHEFAPKPDWIVVRFVLRDERGFELWSKSHRLQFKG